MELKFNTHAKAIHKLASHKTNILRLIRPYINEFTALQIYKMKILPYIDYGDIFYMSANAESLDKLRKLQYRALRICLKTHHRAARIDLLVRSKLPLLCHRRTCHLRKYMYKRSQNQMSILEFIKPQSLIYLYPIQKSWIEVYLLRVEMNGITYLLK